MARRRMSAWGAGALPSVRRATLSLLYIYSEHYTKPGAGRAFHDLAFSIRAAELFWVTDPMARAAMDASHDIPHLTHADIPRPIGLIGFEHPLPAWESEGSAVSQIFGLNALLIDALVWRVRGDHVELTPMTRIGRVSGESMRDLLPIVTLRAAMPLDLDNPPADMPEQERALWSFFAATVVMMMQPTVAQRTTLDVKTGRTRPSVDGGPPVLHEVTVVDLRPLKRITDDEEADGSGRKLRTRHLVRGHWTQQAYGKGRELRRLQWVNSYIRGPEGAPWSGGREAVYVWRR
nr:hypothetical protein [Actinomyces sp.]